MANNDLSIRFTEEVYATKAELARELRITNVDSFWVNVLSYRNQFARVLKLQSIEHKNFGFCFCQSISSLINSIDNKLLRLNRNYSLLFRNQTSLDAFNNLLKDRILKTLHSCAQYSTLLNFAYSNFESNLNDDYFAELYAKANGVREITSFYRRGEYRANGYRALVDHIYDCAPTELIVPMIDNLFEFAKDSSFSSIVKAIIVYYYISYIQPFDLYSNNIAMVYAKSVLAKDSLGELALLLPLEEIFFNHPDDYQKLNNETQKTLDLTYLIKYVLTSLNPIIDELLVASKKFADNVKVEKVDSSLGSINKDEETIKLALKKQPSPLTRTDAKKLEKDLLERDPRLREKEAHFYVVHCTIGKIYTLSNYKRFCRCAYETARTSMDRLAEFGYYRKEQLKNKFIYSPIAR